jgi:hypothetical protein
MSPLRSLLLVAWVSWWSTCGAATADGDTAAAFPAEAVVAARGFLESHCVRCHSATRQEGGVRLDDMGFEIATVAVAERWQKVLNVLNAGDMPPADERQPETVAKTEFLAVLSRTLVSARKVIGDQGGIAALRRLNRREYKNTLLALLGVDVDVSSLPDDVGGHDFDTFGASLFMSSDQFEQYLAVGRRAAAEAIDGWRRSAEPAPPRRTVRTEVEVAARRRMAGLLNGYFLGGYRKAKEWQAAGADPAKAREFGFPDEHEAAFRIRAYEQHGPYLGQYLALPKSDEGAWLTYHAGNYHHTETITIPADAPPGNYLLRLRVAGDEKVSAARRFLEMGVVEGDDFRRRHCFQVASPLSQPQELVIPVTIAAAAPRAFSFREKRHADTAAPAFRNSLARAMNGVGLDCALWIDWVEWDGPVPDPAGTAALLECFGSRCPTAPDDAAARAVLERVATRAFRGIRPDADYLDRLLAVYAGQIEAGGSFADAMAESIAVILASPAFLYLNEPVAPSPAAAAGAAEVDRELSQTELAARLSYFLWAAPPDEALLAAAAAGDLRNPRELSRQAERLLGDPRSFECAKGFTHQWLGVDRLDFFRFDHQLFPDFDEATRDAAKAEIYHTFHFLLQRNLDARKLLASDFVVINGLLADYYGLADVADPEKPKPVTGDHFRMVALPAGSPRGGLVGMAAVLGMGSNGERTSPVERGAWVLRKLLNDPPPPAPPNVPQLSRLDGRKIPVRERLRMHQEEPQCAQCHRAIDPIGFGLENFDAAGRWRTEDHLYKPGFVVANGPHGKVVEASFPIEPAGSFHRGEAFGDYFELRDRIREHGDDFLRGLIEHLYAYALGRPVSFVDADTIDSLVAEAKAEGGGLAAIVRGIVATAEFRTK